MYTETELRDALQYSAARADLVPDGHSAPVTGQPTILNIQQSRRKGRSAWLPAVAIAAVPAAVAAVIVVASGVHSKPATRLVTPGASKPATTSRPMTDRIAVGNLLTLANHAAMPNYELNPRGRPEVVWVGGLSGVEVIALPPGTAFDPGSQMPHAQRVRVGDAEGYYGKVKTDPLDPMTPQTPDSKAGPPKTTLAWRAASGSWIFMRSGEYGINLPLSTLLSQYRTLQVKAVAAPLSVPYRAVWLPAGASLTEGALQTGSPSSDVTLSSGNNSVDINLATDDVARGPVANIAGDPSSYRHLAGFWITVTVHGYPQSIAQKVLDGLDLSRLHAAESSWWPLKVAFTS
jgi:hypothetical protein